MDTLHCRTQLADHKIWDDSELLLRCAFTLYTKGQRSSFWWLIISFVCSSQQTADEASTLLQIRNLFKVTCRQNQSHITVANLRPQSEPLLLLLILLLLLLLIRQVRRLSGRNIESERSFPSHEGSGCIPCSQPHGADVSDTFYSCQLSQMQECAPWVQRFILVCKVVDVQQTGAARIPLLMFIKGINNSETPMHESTKKSHVSTFLW